MAGSQKHPFVGPGGSSTYLYENFFLFCPLTDLGQSLRRYHLSPCAWSSVVEAPNGLLTRMNFSEMVTSMFVY